MKIDKQLISYLEDLSYLRLTDSEKECLSVDLDKILGAMAVLNKIDSECEIQSEYTVRLREDEVTESFDRDLILQNAPAKNDAAFIAPRVI